MWPEQDMKTAVKAVMPTGLKDQLAAARAQDESTLALTQEPPLRFANPFDPSEVFEFPAGTSEDVARQQVADTLLQRARERREKIGALGHLAQVHAHHTVAFRGSGQLVSDHF
jgi:hypothetical protein